MAKGTAKANVKANKQRLILFASITGAITLLHLIVLYFSYNTNYNIDAVDADADADADDDGEEYNDDDEDSDAKEQEAIRLAAEAAAAAPGYVSYNNLQGVVFWLAGHQLPSLYMLQRVGTPRYSSMDPTQIVSCVDLRDPKQLGIFAGFAQDVLWLTWGLQLLSLLVLPAGLAYFFYLIIPGLFVYQVYSFYKSLRRGLMGPESSAAAGGGADQDDADDGNGENSRQKRRQEAKQKKMSQMGGMRQNH